MASALAVLSLRGDRTGEAGYFPTAELPRRWVMLRPSRAPRCRPVRAARHHHVASSALDRTGEIAKQAIGGNAGLTGSQVNTRLQKVKDRLTTKRA